MITAWRCIAVFVIVASYQLVHAAVIKDIRFIGLTKTKESFLREVVESEEGQEFDLQRLQQDEQSIRNLNLFLNVETGYAFTDDSAYVAIEFVLEEAIYLYPIITVSGFQDQLKLQAGFSQINFRGRAESIGLLYQYYDRNSISAFYNMPRHANGKTGSALSVSSFSTIEPLYFEDTVADFRFDNFNISAGAHYWWGRNTSLGMGGMYMYEQYMQRDTSIHVLNGVNFFFHKFQVRCFVDRHSIDYNYERLAGFRIYTYGEYIRTMDYPESGFVKFTSDVWWHSLVQKRGNISMHQRLGIATNNDSPFAPFVLDGFMNVRGVGNRVDRGTAELITNLEYRHTVIRHDWWYLQLAAFTDFGILRDPGAGFRDLSFSSDAAWFLGGGFRVHSRKWYNVIFRLDYSFHLLDPSTRGFTFGFGQFF